jgi:hypothetical protein
MRFTGWKFALQVNVEQGLYGRQVVGVVTILRQVLGIHAWRMQQSVDYAIQ